MNANVKLAIGIVGALAIGGVLMTLATPRDASESQTQRPTAIVYKSPTCGCCSNYVAYLKRAGYEVDVRQVDDAQLQTVKNEQHVPTNGRSCHTTVIDGYVVEGHVPEEAITKLLSERPAVAGIGLAGMPSGSPGMPGGKTAPFDVYAFTADGTTSPFVTD